MKVIDLHFHIMVHNGLHKLGESTMFEDYREENNVGELFEQVEEKEK